MSIWALFVDPWSSGPRNLASLKVCFGNHFASGFCSCCLSSAVCCDYSKIKAMDLPWWSRGWGLLFQSRGCGFYLWLGCKIPRASWPKNQNIKQKQHCSKFKEDFKNIKEKDQSQSGSNFYLDETHLSLETVRDFIFLGSKITADGDCSREIKRCLLLGRKAMTDLDSILKSRNTALPTKVCLVKAMVFHSFQSSHVWMLELDHKESWALKNWCFWTVVLEKALESPLDCKEIQPFHPKGHQS